jgi:hypothetical protein
VNIHDVLIRYWITEKGVSGVVPSAWEGEVRQLQNQKAAPKSGSLVKLWG